MSHATAASDARSSGRRGWVEMGEDGFLARLRQSTVAAAAAATATDATRATAAQAS